MASFSFSCTAAGQGREVDLELELAVIGGPLLPDSLDTALLQAFPAIVAPGLNTRQVGNLGLVFEVFR